MRSIGNFLSIYLMLSGLASGPLVAQAGEAPAGYRIGPQDLVKIEVFELPELNVQRRVSERGTVRLPVIGDVEAQGKTEGELATFLEQILEASYVERASVSVEVVEVRYRSFTVMGAVRNPGEYGLPGDWTLLEALSAAGGLTESHSGSIHVLRRCANGLTDRLTIPVEDLTLRADSQLNIPIFSNDIINVEATVAIHIYLLGEVQSPGVVRFEGGEQATVLFAIARAGGLKDRASPKIVLKRRRDGGEPEQIVVHYKRIIAGKDPDLELEDGDLLIVKESFL